MAVFLERSYSGGILRRGKNPVVCINRLSGHLFKCRGRLHPLRQQGPLLHGGTYRGGERRHAYSHDSGRRFQQLWPYGPHLPFPDPGSGTCHGYAETAGSGRSVPAPPPGLTSRWQPFSFQAVPRSRRTAFLLRSLSFPRFRDSMFFIPFCQAEARIPPCGNAPA